MSFDICHDLDVTKYDVNEELHFLNELYIEHGLKKENWAQFKIYDICEAALWFHFDKQVIF